MPETESKPRTIACTLDRWFVAVLTLSPDVVASILAERDFLLELKKTRPGLEWMVYYNVDCRFFCNCPDSSAEVDEFVDEFDDPENVNGGPWRDVDIDVPAEGDHPTALEHLRISEHVICFEVAGKHDDTSYETPDLLQLLLEMTSGEEKANVL